jgi:hypothetical protein
MRVCGSADQHVARANVKQEQQFLIRIRRSPKILDRQTLKL